MTNLHKLLAAALFGLTALPARAQLPPDPQVPRAQAQQSIQQQSQATHQNNQQLQQQMQGDQARRNNLFATQRPLFNPHTARPYIAPLPHH